MVCFSRRTDPCGIGPDAAGKEVPAHEEEGIATDSFINGKEHHMDGEKRTVFRMLMLAAVVGLLISAGCASSKITAKESGEKIFQAEKSFSEAKDGNASMNAKEALAVAEAKLAKAKEAFGKKNYDGASMLAEQAVADAEYAKAKATTQKQRNEAEEIKKVNNALLQEIRRMTN